MDKCREQAEKDRTQLLALVRTLEQKISEQNQNSQEERWALQQTAATMAARAAAFDREVEFSRNSIEREREQLKVRFIINTSSRNSNNQTQKQNIYIASLSLYYPLH